MTPLSETPSIKPQAPEKSRNRNTKNQAPNTKEIPSSKLQTAALASSLELGAFLEFGAWCLVFGTRCFFGAWSLEFGACCLGSRAESALDLGLAACLAFMLMNLSALQVVNLVVVVVAGGRAAGPCRA
jgi:hypothetical protein